MPTYAITGASGYIGTRMTRHLLDADPENRVLGFDVRAPRVADPRFEFQYLDVRDRRLAGALAAAPPIRSLLHFAFVLDPLYDEREMRDIDINGTRNVLEAALAANVPHVLATSSTTAYGALRDNPVPLDENDPPRAEPDFVYAHDKRLMDEMLGDFARAHAAVKVCTLRPCIVLGPNVANYIVYLMLRQPMVALLDGLDPPYQFVHEDDLVGLIARCLERQADGVWNAVGSGTVKVSELATLQGKRAVYTPYRAARGVVWLTQRTKLLPFSLPPGILDYFRWPWIASGQKAERELGWKPRYSSRACFDIVVERRKAVLEAFDAQIRTRGKR
jgi:UDP-glucose 4-epimerase